MIGSGRRERVNQGARAAAVCAQQRRRYQQLQASAALGQTKIRGNSASTEGWPSAQGDIAWGTTLGRLTRCLPFGNGHIGPAPVRRARREGGQKRG